MFVANSPEWAFHSALERFLIYSFLFPFRLEFAEDFCSFPVGCAPWKSSFPERYENLNSSHGTSFFFNKKKQFPFPMKFYSKLDINQIFSKRYRHFCIISKYVSANSSLNVSRYITFFFLELRALFKNASKFRNRKQKIKNNCVA